MMLDVMRRVQELVSQEKHNPTAHTSAKDLSINQEHVHLNPLTKSPHTPSRAGFRVQSCSRVSDLVLCLACKLGAP